MPDAAVPIPTPAEADAPPPRLSCLCSDAGTAGRLTLAGEVDRASAPRLEAVLSHARTRFALVIVDLRQVNFMDRSGARALLTAARGIRAAGGRLLVIRGPAAVDRVLRLAGVDDQLELVSLAADRPLLEPA